LRKGPVSFAESEKLLYALGKDDILPSIISFIFFPSQGRDREGEIPVLAVRQEAAHGEPGQALPQVNQSIDKLWHRKRGYILSKVY
jgi:hypothetical protein